MSVCAQQITWRFICCCFYLQPCRFVHKDNKVLYNSDHASDCVTGTETADHSSACYRCDACDVLYHSTGWLSIKHPVTYLLHHNTGWLGIKHPVTYLLHYNTGWLGIKHPVTYLLYHSDSLISHTSLANDSIIIAITLHCYSPTSTTSLCSKPFTQKRIHVHIYSV